MLNFSVAQNHLRKVLVVSGIGIAVQDLIQSLSTPLIKMLTSVLPEVHL